ncbi:MAG: peptide transporter, partial [Agathobacter sp.]|nr:peptide transporter [Agathobacter sp.]
MKHFFHLNDFTKKEIGQIFELADKLKADKGVCDWLKGKTIVLFFPESSIRTRVSFEKGIKMLGGDTILFPPEALDKKEDIKDVIGYLENWADMVIVRHKDLSLIEYMAKHSKIPIINAMTSVN